MVKTFTKGLRMTKSMICSWCCMVLLFAAWQGTAHQAFGAKHATFRSDKAAGRFEGRTSAKTSCSNRSTASARHSARGAAQQDEKPEPQSTRRGRSNVRRSDTTSGHQDAPEPSRGTPRSTTSQSRLERTQPGQQDGPTTSINIPANEDDPDPTPADQRKYSFSIKNSSYEHLIAGIAHQTGLGVIGEAPQGGSVDFITDEILSFSEMLARVRRLLFNYKPTDPYWMNFDGNVFEIRRVSDWPRYLPKDRWFQNVDKLRDSGFSEDDLAMVVYRPPSGSVAQLAEVRNYLPDYVRVAPIEDLNSVTIFALVRDIEMYMWLARFLGGEGADPREIEKIPVQYISPSDAVTKLQSLMGSDESRKNPRRRPTPKTPSSALETLEEPDVTLMPDDEQGVIIVVAMPSVIKEIKKYLPYIDVDTSLPDYVPTLLTLKHGDPDEIIQIVRQVLKAGETAADKKPQTGSQRRGRRKTAKSGPPTPVTVNEIIMLAHPSGEAIIVYADEEDVARVRRLVEQFDVPSEVRAEPIPVAGMDAAKLIAGINNVLYGEEQPKDAPIQMTADPSGAMIWFTGSKRDLAEVRNLVAILDVPEDVVKLHTMDLQHQRAAFAVTMLRLFDKGESAGPAGTGNKRRRPSSKTPTEDPSKFTADEEADRIYVMCTDDEWAEYLPFIESLEAAAANDSQPFVKLTVVNIAPEDAMKQLTAALPMVEGSRKISYLATDDAVLVVGASATMLSHIQAILAEIDQPYEIIERTFDIKYADPGEIQTALETLLSGERQPRHRSERVLPKAGKPTDQHTTIVLEPSGDTEMTIVRIGDRLLVRTTPSLMERIAAFIAEFDVPGPTPELRVYNDFPPTADIEMIAAMLSNAMDGSVTGVSNSRRAKPGAADNQAGPRFIPQPESRRLLVFADPDEFKEIESFLAVLRRGDDLDPILVQFFTLKHADADEVVEKIEPLLALKVQRLVQSGELINEPVDPSKPKSPRARRTPSDNDRYHLEPDGRNKRIAVAGPQIIVDEVEQLILAFDKPMEDADRPVVRTVALQNSDAEEMTKAVKEMMDNASPTRRRAVRTSARGTAPTSSDDEFMMTVAPVPGGRAVVLRGLEEDVLEAQAWVKELDAQAISGQTMKVYTIEYANVNWIADLIMNTVDTPQAEASKRVVPNRQKGSKESEGEDDEFDLSPIKTHKGYELFVQTDTVSRTMIVSTTPAKMTQVDAIVERFDQAESVVPPMTDIPKFLYTLEYADPFAVSFDLQMFFKKMWRPANMVPKVEDALFGNNLIISYPDESRFDEIRGIIAKFFDQPDPSDIEPAQVLFAEPQDMSLEQVMDWILAKHGDQIEVVSIPEKEGPGFDVHRIRPLGSGTHECVWPRSLLQSVQILASAVAQTEEENQPPLQEDEPEDVVDESLEPVDPNQVLIDNTMELLGTTDSPSGTTTSQSDNDKSRKKRKGLAGGKLNIRVDPEKGVLIVDGPRHLVDDFEKWMKDLEEQKGKLPEKPDIRVYRVQHIDVYQAKEVIEEMFNTPRQQLNQIRQMQMQQMQMERFQAAQTARQQQQQQRNKQQGGAESQQGQQPGQQPGQQGRLGQQPQLNIPIPQLPQTSVRVWADPDSRALILRAATSQYPEILELLATIDQPSPLKREMKVFPLVKLGATDVEAMLKQILELDEESTKRKSVGRRVGADDAASPGAMLPQEIMAKARTGGPPVNIHPRDITISSNVDANSILVVAPQEAVDYIGTLIESLENQELPERVSKHYELQYALTAEVAEYLTDHFENKRPGSHGVALRGKGASTGSATSSLNQPAFVAYPRLNLLSVQATEEQYPEIDELIARLDVAGFEDEWVEVPLAFSDAQEVVAVIAEMYVGGGAAGRAKSPGGGPQVKVVGNPGGRVVFFSAPRPLHESIRETIARIEEESKSVSEVRIIHLEHAGAQSVASALEAAYGGRGGSTRRGGNGRAVSGERFTIVADEPSQSLFVTADDAMFERVESLARKLDTPRELFDFRIYPLKHADARNVYDRLNKLVTDYLRRLGPSSSDIEPFSVEVDEKTNALIVLGSPLVFGFVENALKTIDTPLAAGEPMLTEVYSLKYADPAALNTAVMNMFKGDQGGSQSYAEQVTSHPDSSTQSLIVTASAKNHERVRDMVAKADVRQVVDQDVYVVTLQNAETEPVAQTLNEIFIRSGGTRRSASQGQQISISALKGSRAVLVRCGQEDFEEIKTVIAELDSEEATTGGAVRVVTLQSGDANEVLTAMQEYLRKPGAHGGGRNPELAGDVRLSALIQSNALVISGDEEEVNHIEQTVRAMDGAAEQGNVPQVIQLKHANALMILPTLEQLFSDQVRSGRRSGQEPPVIVANEFGNSLMVKASPTDFNAVKAAVELLDKPETAMFNETHRIVKVASGVNIEQLAFDIQEAVNTTAQSLADQGGAGSRGGSRKAVPSVVITPNKRTGVLLVSGSPSLFNQVEDLAKQFGDMGTAGDTKTIMIRPKNVAVEDIQRLIEQLTEQEPTDGAGRSPNTRNRGGTRPRRPSPSGGGRR